MKKIALFALLALTLSTSVGCTNMSRTNQGVLSGAAIGTAAGFGIAAVSGGLLGTGAIAGAIAGGIAGGFIGNQRDW